MQPRIRKTFNTLKPLQNIMQSLTGTEVTVAVDSRTNMGDFAWGLPCASRNNLGLTHADAHCSNWIWMIHPYFQTR